MSLSQYMEIVALQRRVGSCVAFLIGLGDKFFSSGMTEVDRDLIPTILSRVPSSVTPGLFQSYAMLLWFTLEINKQINQNNLAAWLIVYEKVVASEPSVVAHTLLGEEPHTGVFNRDFA